MTDLHIHNVSGSDTEARVLLVDDDRKFAGLTAEYLETFGFVVTCAYTGAEGVSAATAAGVPAWSAVILDLMLPKMDGFEVLRRIRESSNVPVLMLTARGEEVDRIVGLELGADDYVPKTSSVRELLARLRAVIRRSRHLEVSGGVVEWVVGPVRLLEEARRVFLDDRPVMLTAVEFDLLLVLCKARGRVKSRDQLAEEIRDKKHEMFDRSIDMHISAVRRKLGDDPRHPRLIHTIRGMGYMMDPEHRVDGSKSGATL